MHSAATYSARLAGLLIAASLGLACGEGGLVKEEPGPLDAADAGDEPSFPLDAGSTSEDSGVIGPSEDAGTTLPDASAPDVSTPPPDAGTPPTPDAGAAADAGPGLIGPTCFPDIWDPNANGPNYDQFAPVMGSHCFGTNHQTITGVERVVFLGDSVTVGTPPTPSDEYYRATLADRLATHFNLQAPSALWKRSSIASGTSLQRDSGDFWSCAKWGARTDDLIEDNSQIVDCFPAAEIDKRTLVIMTIGGNDIAAITKAGTPTGGHSVAEVELMTQEFVAKLNDAVVWLKDPVNVPGGVYVVFANMYEFTDATGDVLSCPAAGVAGFDEPWADQSELERLVIWANEQFMSIAVQTQTDMIMTLEHFCGHGYHNDDATGRCYRGASTPRWFDLSCIHPTPAGHAVISDMFMAEVTE